MRSARRPLQDRDPNIQNLPSRPVKRARIHGPEAIDPIAIHEDIEGFPGLRRQHIEVQAPPRRDASPSRASPLTYHTPPNPQQQRRDRRRRRAELRRQEQLQEQREQEQRRLQEEEERWLQEEEERREQEEQDEDLRPGTAVREALEAQAQLDAQREAEAGLRNGRNGRNGGAQPPARRPPIRNNAALIQNYTNPPVRDLGRMDIICRKCQAKHWKAEESKKKKQLDRLTRL